jgi:hypothetical protein
LAGKIAVGPDVKGGKASAPGFGDNQGLAIGTDHSPVREDQTVCGHARSAVRRDHDEDRWNRIQRSGAIYFEAEVADIGAALGVDDHVIQATRRDMA